MHRILVVDDDSRLRTLMGKPLSNAGYIVSFGEDGLDGLNVLDQQPADLIILDAVMPGMNGSTFLKTIRSDGHARVPVIVISGHPKEDIVKKFNGHPLDHFLCKCEERFIDRLLGMVGEILGNTHT